MTAVAPPEPPPPRAPTLQLIAGFKIGKGLLLLLAALGIFALAGKDLSDAFDDFLRLIQLDPGRRIFIRIGHWLDTFTPANVKAIASGTLLFGLFLVTSGVGLALRAAWAIWLAIGESACFIPVEIFELLRRRLPGTDAHRMFAHPKIALGLLLAANVFIVWYLFQNRKRLFRHHHRPIEETAPSVLSA